MRTQRLLLAAIGTCVLGVAVFIKMLGRDDPQLEGSDDSVAVFAPSPQAATGLERTPGIESTAPGLGSPGQSIREVTREDCVQLLNQAKEFLETEWTEGPRLGGPQMIAELEKLRLDTIDRSDQEGYLVAFMQEESRGAKSFTASTVKEFAIHAASADSPVLAWHALRACDQPGRTCSFDQYLEQQLLDLDRNNAEAWVIVAQMRHRRGDAAGALAAMQGAAQAPTSTWYLTETMAMYERALARYTSIPLTDRADVARSKATVSSPTWAGWMCRAESETSSAWLEACLGFAARRAERNVSDTAEEYGYSLRKELQNAAGDTEGAAQAAGKISLLRAQRREADQVMDVLHFLRKELATSSPERFHAQLQAIREFGEIEGYRRFLLQELPPFLERAGWLKMPAAHECFAKYIQEPKAVKPDSFITSPPG